MSDPMLDYRSGGRIEVNGFCFEEMRHGQPFQMERHAHAEAHFALVVSGEVENRYADRTCVAGPMTFAYTPPECEHRTFYATPVRALYVSIRASGLERFGSRVAGAPQEFREGPALTIGRRMHDEYGIVDDHRALMMEGLMLELVATMARHELRPEAAKSPRWLLQAQEILHAEAGGTLTIGEIADRVGVHPVHLMRSFRRRFGEPIGTYARNLRIARACQRLQSLTAEETLGGLAQELGFSDQSQFNRAFRKKTGLTPTQWLATAKEGL
ncbi:AraC family transcriptional regulator [bacterium]|nr:MAG: AraC family transcriptional regulator [bacterium]